MHAGGKIIDKSFDSMYTKKHRNNAVSITSSRGTLIVYTGVGSIIDDNR